MYSIKTDLGVLGNATVNKDLTVNGNAVFKQNLSVTGTVDFTTATFTEINVSGAANLTDLTASGDTNLNTLTVTGKTSLQDVEINGTLTGNYTFDSGNFNAITVTGLSDLNNVAIKGSTTLTGNVTGTTSTVSVNQVRILGSDGILQFAYNDPSRPTDIKSSIEPYQISSDKVVSSNVVADEATIGVVGGTAGLTALGVAKVDYLNIIGNSTIGTSQPQLTVAGTSVLSGKTTVGDLEITGEVSGLSFSDLNVTSLTVSGLSTLAGVSVSGNVSGAPSSIASFSTFTVRDGESGNHGIIQFAYNDSTRPSDIKSSIEPYKVSTNDLVSRKFDTDAANIGVIGGTSGLHALGKATIDYLNITGNSTIGTAETQLKVAGASVLHDTTVNNLTINGSVSGLSFTDLDVNTLNVSGASTLAGATLTGNITGSNTSIAKFSTFTVADGTAGNHGIIQFDYADAARPNDIKSSVEPYKVSTTDVAAKDVVSDAATIGVVGGTSGLHALGKATIDYLKIAGNSTIGTATPQLEVTGKSILGDVDFTGTVTGLTVDVSGQDLTPNSVVATDGLSGDTLASTTTTSVGTDLTVGGTSVLTGKLTAPAADFSGDINVTGQTVTVKDLVVTGTTTGVTAVADVDGLDIAPKSVAVTTTLGVAGKSTLGEVQTGAATLSSATVTGTSTLATTTATNLSASQLTVTGTTSLAGVTATTLAVPNITGNTTFANDVTITGTLSPATIDLSTTDVDAQSVSTTGDVNVGGNLAVTGTVDLSAADVSVKSLTTPGVVTSSNATNPSTLPLLHSTTVTTTNADITDLTVTGETVVAAVNASGKVTAASVETATISNTAGITLSNNTIASGDLTVNGALILAGTLDLESVDITSKSITTTEGATIGGSLSVAGTVDLSGADVTALSFVSSDALKTNTFPKLASTESVIGTLSVTGASTLHALTVSTDANITGEAYIGTLNVTGQSALSILSATSVSSAKFTTSGTTISLDKNTEITGNLHATGTLTAGAIDLSTTDVTVKSLDSLGNAHITGDLTVDGVFDLSATNLNAASLASTGNTTVGADLVLTTGTITGSPDISGTLNVTGATTLAGLTAGVSGLGNTSVTGTLGVSGTTTLAHVVANSASVTGTATLGSLAVPVGDTSFGGKLTVAGDTVVEKLTVNGQLVPTGGIDLSGSDISANSVDTVAGVNVGTLLAVTGNATVGGTLTSTGAGKFGSVTSDNGLTVTAGATTLGGAITATGAGKFASVTADNGATVTAGNLVVTAGNISQNGAATSTASFKKTSTTNLHVGTLVWDEESYIAEVGGSVHISGDLDIDGTINAAINLTGRDIAPRSIATSQSITVGTTLSVTGQATMASAIIGAAESVNNNLQINGNTVCTGDFTVGGSIIGTLDQTTSDVVAKSITATTFVKGATVQSTGTLSVGTTSTFGGKVTISAGGLAVTGGTISDTLESTTTLQVGTTSTFGGKVTISAGGLAVTGGTTTDTLTATGLSTLAAVNATNVSASGTLAVTGTSTFTGKATVVDLESTGTITANNLTVTGTLTTDIADLVTDSVVTKSYYVTPAASSTASAATWTPSGTSNVENITVTANTTIMPIPNVKGAGSWYFYITQDATGQHTVSMDPAYGIIGGEINKSPNSVSIVQVIYCGVGSQYDVFIAQRL